MWCPNSWTKMYGDHTLSAATVLYKPKMPPPPYVALFTRISTASYGAFAATSRNALLSNVST